jgi:hypothetical protein
MSQWNYQREEQSRLSPGDYRVEIVDVQHTRSKTSGNEMLVITVKPNGSNIKIQYYIVRNQYFNRNMTQFFDAFPQIKEGDFNFLGWVGCVGAARLKEDENGYLKVAWFLDAKRAEKLPPWQGDVPERQTVTEIGGFEEIEDDSDLPF